MPEEIVGVQDLLRKLGNVESLVVQKNVVARSVRAGCQPIRDRAEELAANIDDPETVGSRVRDNIIVAVLEQTATEAIGKIGDSRQGFMGQFAEFGTATQPATPFLRPAFDEKIAEATKIMGETLADEIEKAFK